MMTVMVMMMMMTMTVIMIMMMYTLLNNHNFTDTDLRPIASRFVIKIVIVSDLHSSNFAQHAPGYPLTMLPSRSRWVSAMFAPHDATSNLIYILIASHIAQTPQTASELKKGLKCIVIHLNPNTAQRDATNVYYNDGNLKYIERCT